MNHGSVHQKWPHKRVWANHGQLLLKHPKYWPFRLFYFWGPHNLYSYLTHFADRNRGVQQPGHTWASQPRWTWSASTSCWTVPTGGGKSSLNKLESKLQARQFTIFYTKKWINSLLRLQWNPRTRTGIGKSVTVSDCHSSSSFFTVCMANWGLQKQSL